MLAIALALALNSLPTDAPRADLDRSSVHGKSREWLGQEFLRVEAARPSAALFIGPVALAVVGLISVLAGLVVDSLDRCWHPLSPGNQCDAAQAGAPALALWIAGGGGFLSGFALSAWVDHLREPGGARLAELQRALNESRP